MPTYSFIVEFNDGSWMAVFEAGHDANEAKQGVWLRFPTAVKVYSDVVLLAEGEVK